jgi:diguanylate cyclase (GGDEF)-like protein
VPQLDDPPSRRKSDLDTEGSETRLKVLAVDDDLGYLKYLEYVLNRGGFDVELAHDGSAAIERICRGGGVDLLIIDLTMPGLDGIETVARIRQEPHCSSLYTILLTAAGGSDTKLRALESGFDDFLSKASPEPEILAKIRSAARRLEMERRILRRNEQLEFLALTDELTGVANRRAIFSAGQDMLAAGRKLTVVLFDLDRFKQVNDTFGHLAGDRILADVASAFRAHTRYADVIGRYGGDEFVLLLPETASEQACQIAERVVARIRQLTWSIFESQVTIGAQWGAAESHSGSTLSDLLAQCDQALYRKKQGSGSASPLFSSERRRADLGNL